MSLYCLDAIFVAPWDHDYPYNIFPTLWHKISENKKSLLSSKKYLMK